MLELDPRYAPTTTPFRAQEQTRSYTLDPRQRELIADAGTWMLMAGILGALNAALWLVDAVLQSDFSFAMADDLLLLLFSGLFVEAGLVLRRVDGARTGDDLRLVMAALGRLKVVFVGKVLLLALFTALFGTVLLGFLALMFA